MFKKLKTIIVISYVVVTVLFFTSFSFITYKVFFDYTTREISEARLTGVNESMSRISSFITSVKDSGIYFVTNRNAIRILSNNDLTTYESIVEQRTLTELMNNIASFKKGIHSIELFTDRYDDSPAVAGAQIFSTKLLYEEPWFHLMEHNQNGWIPKHESPTSSHNFVSYFHQLRNQRGDMVGYIKVNVLADRFFESMYDVNFAGSMDEPLILIDSNYRIIGQTNTKEAHGILDKVITYEEDEKYGRLHESYSQYFNYYDMLEEGNNNYMLVISKPNEDYWRLVHLVPIDSLYSETKKLGMYISLLGIVFLILLIPIAYLVGKSLLNPINKLIHGMQQVESGNFEVRVEPHYIEEYKTMATNFNNMTYQLDKSLKDLKRENRAKREAEIRTLQNQIVPHFLYNTLDMIHWRALDYQAEDISSMVIQLSKMYRIGLSGGQSFIPLRDELEHVKCYVQLQEARLKTEIKYEVRVPATIKDVFVPKIILQPFVENSLKHGYPRDCREAIYICISARREENNLLIEVVDHGVGLPANWNDERKLGIGIKNIQERIMLYCGTEYGVILKGEEGKGTIVEMKLPIIENRDGLKNI